LGVPYPTNPAQQSKNGIIFSLTFSITSTKLLTHSPKKEKGILA
jgi:hypothetical protein